MEYCKWCGKEITRHKTKKWTHEDGDIFGRVWRKGKQKWQPRYVIDHRAMPEEGI